MFDETGDIVETSQAALVCPFGAFPTRSIAEDAVVTIEQGTTPRLPTRAVLTTSRSANFDAQLLLGTIIPQLPQDMVVQGCSAAVWRIRARVPLGELAFESWWQEPAGDADGGPSSGEGLDAITWRTPVAAITLGTEDGEFLKYRALDGEAMPPSLAQQLHVSTVEYLPHGLRLSLREIPVNSVVQIQFVLAWTDAYTDESPSTWFAVEQRPKDILRQLLHGTG
jgi:hypothetical protein